MQRERQRVGAGAVTSDSETATKPRDPPTVGAFALGEIGAATPAAFHPRHSRAGRGMECRPESRTPPGRCGRASLRDTLPPHDRVARAQPVSPHDQHCEETAYPMDAI